MRTSKENLKMGKSEILVGFFRIANFEVSRLERPNVSYKKLGSGHSTKSFLIQNEFLSILVLNFS